MIRLVRTLALAALLLASPAFAGPTGVNTVQVNGAMTGALITGTAKITNNTNLLPAGPTGTVLQIGQADGVFDRTLIDSYGGNASYTCRRADTSAANPSAVQSNENLCGMASFGYGQSAYSSASRAGVVFSASENWSDSAQGTQGNITATKNTTTTTAIVVQWDGYGHERIGTTNTVPVITSCGTSPSTARGTDFGGEVTEGTTATGCTITFANAYTTAPFCVVSLQTQQVAFAYTISTTAITVTNTSATGDKINWICNGL